MTTNAESSAPPLDPESPAFRRVKPLPKRRRTAALNAISHEYKPSDTNSFSFQDPHALAALADLHARPYFSQLNAQQAIRDLFSSDSGDTRQNSDFTGLYSNPSVPSVVPAVPDTDDQLESDYVDHLQLPANTKKRKVPGLNRSASQTGDTAIPALGTGLGLSDHGSEAPVTDGALQLAAHRLRVDGPQDIDALNSSIRPTPSEVPRNHSRESLVTRASLQHKALVNTRKKQFTAVLDDFPEGDSLALEQALTARYPQLDALFDSKGSKYPRLSRKSSLKKRLKPLGDSIRANTASFPTGEFTFAHPCTSA